MTQDEADILNGLSAQMAAVPTTLGINDAMKRLRAIRNEFIPPPKKMPGLGAGTEFGGYLDRIVIFHRDRICGRAAAPVAIEVDEFPPEPGPEPAPTDQPALDSQPGDGA